MKKKEQGITLIALVVTIIVLLILAGVTIAMVLGQDGIFKKAQTAADRTEEMQEIEQVRMAVLEAKTNYITGDKTKEFREELEESVKKIYPDGKVTQRGTGEKTICTITLPNGNQYEVDGMGNVTKKEPTKPVDPTEVWYKIEGTTLYLSKSNNDLGEYTKLNQNGSIPAWAGSSSNQSPITQVIIENEIAPTSTQNWFIYCSNLTEIGSKINDEYVPNDLSNLNTSNVRDMIAMFAYCSNLTNLEVGTFDTSNVTRMSQMFWNCSKLTSIDLSEFDTSKVTDMFGMFAYCSNLTSLEVGTFDTSNVTRMNQMFQDCSKLTSIGLSNFNTSNVTTMNWMFINCHNLTSIDLSNFNTSNVTDMSLMFQNCNNLASIDVSNFNTSKVTNISAMFASCSNLTNLDLSNFNTSNVTNMSRMFNNVKCPVWVGPNWNLTESETNYSGTFIR